MNKADTFEMKEIEKKFSTDVKKKEGVKLKFLDYNFKGFPAIATLTKFSTACKMMLKILKADVYNYV